jgi:hypothetical protein
MSKIPFITIILSKYHNREGRLVRGKSRRFSSLPYSTTLLQDSYRRPLTNRDDSPILGARLRLRLGPKPAPAKVGDE